MPAWIPNQPKIKEIVMKNTKEAALKELTAEEIDQVNGGINGYEGAGAIMAVIGFGSLFTPIGPITAGIAIGSAGGAGDIAIFC